MKVLRDKMCKTKCNTMVSAMNVCKMACYFFKEGFNTMVFSRHGRTTSIPWMLSLTRVMSRFLSSRNDFTLLKIVSASQRDRFNKSRKPFSVFPALFSTILHINDNCEWLPSSVDSKTI